MMIRFSSHFVMLFILLNVLYSPGSALENDSNLRLGNAVALGGESNEDQLQSPVKTDSDKKQSPLSSAPNENIPDKRGLFKKLLKKKFKKFLKKAAMRALGLTSAPNQHIPVARQSGALFTEQ
ncbi:myc target protein 1 homolog isoform X3 [Scyliorhinus canicula]|nr:myc target protein 1 homolog isoform X3 [Scyliorhinus canicula]